MIKVFLINHLKLTVETVEVTFGSTVSDILQEKSITDEDILVRRNRTECSLTDVVFDHDKISVVSKHLRE